MRHKQTVSRLALAALAGLVALALAGVVALSELRAGQVPLFRQILAAGPGFALVIENGHFCVPDAPLAACNTGVRRELRVWYYTRGAKQEILTHIWKR